MHIRITITKDGEVQFDFEGYKGKTCISEFERIVKLLVQQGVDVKLVSQVLKPDAIGSRDSVRV